MARHLQQLLRVVPQHASHDQPAALLLQQQQPTHQRQQQRQGQPHKQRQQQCQKEGIHVHLQLLRAVPQRA